MSQIPLKRKLLFLGSDTFSRLCLNTMIQRNVNATIDVLSPPKGKRNTPIYDFHKFCESNKYSVDVIPGINVKEEWKNIDTKLGNYEVGIVASFRHMIPSYIIDKFSIGMYVVHPSLLPKYRGACPIQHALLNGELKTGVSLIQISKKKFDAGRIVLQSEIDVKENDNYGILRDTLAVEGGKLCSTLINGDIHNYNTNSKEQDESLSTPAKLFTGNDYCYLDFSRNSSLEIIRKYRAFTGSSEHPISHMTLNGSMRVVVFGELSRCSIMSSTSSDSSKTEGDVDSQITNELTGVDSIPNGVLHWNQKLNKDHLYIKCADGKWLKFKWLNIEGVGKVIAHKLMINFFGNHRYKPSHPKFLYKIGEMTSE